jgi:DNA phosphorothioation-associated putative methyltransferase
MAQRILYGKTAIKRNEGSAPIRFLVKNGFLARALYEIFDWGCGRSDDLIYLSGLGYTVDGFDPNHKTPEGFYGISPDKVYGTDRVYNWVHCGYVLNVLPSHSDRMKVLTEIYDFLPDGGRLSVAVRPSKEVEGSITSKWRPFSDGWLTSAQTFQKGFYPFELIPMLKETGFHKAHIVKSSPLIALAEKR